MKIGRELFDTIREWAEINRDLADGKPRDQVRNEALADKRLRLSAADRAIYDERIHDVIQKLNERLK